MGYDHLSNLLPHKSSYVDQIIIDKNISQRDKNTSPQQINLNLTKKIINLLLSLRKQSVKQELRHLIQRKIFDLTTTNLDPTSYNEVE